MKYSRCYCKLYKQQNYARFVLCWSLSNCLVWFWFAVRNLRMHLIPFCRPRGPQANRHKVVQSAQTKDFLRNGRRTSPKITLWNYTKNNKKYAPFVLCWSMSNCLVWFWFWFAVRNHRMHLIPFCRPRGPQAKRHKVVQLAQTKDFLRNRRNTPPNLSLWNYTLGGRGTIKVIRSSISWNGPNCVFRPYLKTSFAPQTKGILDWEGQFSRQKAEAV